ncbi:MAG: phosphoglycerate kinase [Candidatus Jorgensenbacteria bacterium]
MIRFISPPILKKFWGKTCLLRIDLNAKPGREKKFLRVEAVMPTIKTLLKNRNKVVILSHRGRPTTKTDSKSSLRPFVPILSRRLGKRVAFVSDFRLPDAGEVFLLENLRFWKEEEKNDAKFAKKLASLGDFYVNDAFAVSHRKDASVSAITRHLPSYGGLLLKKEIENLDLAAKKARKPFVVVIGGAKVGDKLGIMSYLWKKADCFLLGSGPAATFFAAKGYPIGDSLVDRRSIPKIRKFIGSKKVILPLDVEMKDKRILDIGPGTQRHYSEMIRKARTIIWSGPVGMFEKKGFSDGTKAIWMAMLKNKKARIVIGGGETLASLSLIRNSMSLIPKNVFLSTGGGAMLEYLSGKKLPGIAALERASLAKGGKL